MISEVQTISASDANKSSGYRIAWGQQYPGILEDMLRVYRQDNGKHIAVQGRFALYESASLANMIDAAILKARQAEVDSAISVLMGNGAEAALQILRERRATLNMIEREQPEPEPEPNSDAPFRVKAPE